MRRSTRHTHTTSSRPGLMTRLRGGHGRTHTTKRTSPRGTTTTTTTTTRTTRHHGTATGHHHKRKVTLGDKISGAMMRLRGSLTRRPGKKAAGTRRMHGTDGRGSRATRVY